MSRKPFNTRWAQGVETQDSSASFQEPDNIRLTTGWEGGADKDAPPAGQENWWHNRVDSALQGVERTGVMAYHPQAIYAAGAPAYAPDGNYYESLVSANQGNDPTSTSGFWRFVGVSFFSGSDPGDIKVVAHNGIPSQGWLKCNGSAVLKSSYPRLFAMIGTLWNTGGETNTQFRLPDFRGEFLRGFDDGRGVDSGRQFGSFQTDETRSHRHELRNDGTGAANGQATSDFRVDGSISVGYTDYFGGAETRPRNKPVNYWIKY